MIRTVVVAIALLYASQSHSKDCQLASGGLQSGVMQFECASVLEFGPVSASLPIDASLTLEMVDNSAIVNVTATGLLDDLKAKFHQALAAELNKNTCEEKVEVRSASISISDQLLLAAANIRVRQDICIGPLKTKGIRKTGDVSVILTPFTDGRSIGLKPVDAAVDLSDIEKKLLDLIGTNPREKIITEIASALIVSVDDLVKIEKLAEKITINSVRFVSDNSIEATAKAALSSLEVLELAAGL